MSDIPFEVQTDIIQRIPDTKSVIRCRSVSKAWKSVIDSKELVAAHTLRHQAHNRHHLLIRTQDCVDEQVKYYSIVDDDDTFPHQKVSMFVPDSVDKFSVDYVIILGGSHGLFCLYEPEKNTAVIWNPSIRKTVAIPVPEEPEYFTVFGFGVCPRNLDPKLVKITFLSDLGFLLGHVNAFTQVEVFTLSSGGTWRSPLSSSNLPHKSIQFGHSQAVVDGFIYWVGFDSINVDNEFRSFKLIMSFDLTTEEFTKVNLPDPLALHPNFLISLSNLKESLAVLEFGMYAWRRICDVWMMIGHGCTRSFNKLYSISTTDALIRTTLGFRKSGTPIIEVHEAQAESYFKIDSLAIYEPESNNITNIGIHKLKGSFFVHSYTETLLLLSVLPQ